MFSYFDHHYLQNLTSCSECSTDRPSPVALKGDQDRYGTARAHRGVDGKMNAREPAKLPCDASPVGFLARLRQARQPRPRARRRALIADLPMHSSLYSRRAGDSISLFVPPFVHCCLFCAVSVSGILRLDLP